MMSRNSVFRGRLQLAATPSRSHSCRLQSFSLFDIARIHPPYFGIEGKEEGTTPYKWNHSERVILEIASLLSKPSGTISGPVNYTPFHCLCGSKTLRLSRWLMQFYRMFILNSEFITLMQVGELIWIILLCSGALLLIISFKVVWGAIGHS